MKNLTLSTKQDRLIDGELRLKDGGYVGLAGAEMTAFNDGSVLDVISAAPFEEQDRLSSRLVKGRGRNGRAAYFELPRHVSRRSGFQISVFPTIRSVIPDASSPSK